MGRIELRGEHLADAAVGDTHHADPVAEHPWLVCDRLDHVVTVEVLQWLEEVVGAARAARPAHVHVDDSEAHQVREDGDAVDRPGWVRVPISRVLDQRRVRRKIVGSLRKRSAGRQAGLTRGTGWRVHVDGEPRPVAGGEVGVAAVRDRLAVHARIPRRGGVVVHHERCGLVPGCVSHDVARARRHIAEQQAAERVGVLR